MSPRAQRRAVANSQRHGGPASECPVRGRCSKSFLPPAKRPRLPAGTDEPHPDATSCARGRDPIGGDVWPWLEVASWRILEVSSDPERR